MVRFPAPDLPPVRRMIHGICSSERIVDSSPSGDGSDNKVLVAGGCDLIVPIPLFYQHEGAAIGEIIHLSWIKTKLYCRGVVFYNAAGRRAWEQIEAYKLRGLSCGFTRDHYEIRIKEQEGVVKYFDRYAITEISIVHRPLNKDCHLAIFSGGCEGRVAGQRSLSEHRQINDRARKLLASLEKQFPSSSRRSARQKFSPADIQHLWAQRKKGI
jgi:Caudovirus prohead serine protease